MQHVIPLTYMFVLKKNLGHRHRVYVPPLNVLVVLKNSEIQNYYYYYY